MTTVLRYDRAQVAAKGTRIPSGGLRVSSELTKSGVFEYQDADGRVVREWRPPEEVAKADALASIEDLPITIGHPPIGVTLDMWGRLSAGHVRSVTKQDRGTDVIVRGVLVAGRKDAVEGLASGKYAETSMGYRCRLDETPGVTPTGQQYDRVQRDFVYNHIAILPPGGARLGTRVDGEGAPVLRLDSAGNQIADDEPETPIMKVTIKKDGKDHEVEKGSDEHLSYLEAQRDAEKARADANDVELVKFREDAKKTERASLEGACSKIIGKDFKADGKTDRQLREEVIAKRLPSIKCDGKDETYVGAMFDAALAVAAPAPKVAGSQQLVKALASAGTKGRADGAAAGGESGEDDDEDEAFMKKAKDNKKKADSAWERNDSEAR